jgi:hypothetical protein
MQQGAFDRAMQCLTGFDALMTLQAAYPNKIVIYDYDTTEFWLADNVQDAKKKLGARLMPMASRPGFLEPVIETPYLVVLTAATGSLLSKISSKDGKGLTIGEMRQVLAAGYMTPLEELQTAGRVETPPVGLQAPYMLLKYDIEQINQEATGEQALWTECQRRLEKKLDAHRTKVYEVEAESWNEMLDSISEEDWEAIWEAHPSAAQIAWEFTELVKQGKL